MSGAARAGTYMPYLSDDESELAESDLESDTEPEDPRFALLRAPTMRAAIMKETGTVAADQWATWDPSAVVTDLKDHVYLDPPKTTKTSLVCIKSINRDRNVWPSPYRFQLKLPKVYKNVTKFQLVQLSFPNGNSQNLSQATLLTSSIVKNLVERGIPSTCISDCISLIDCGGGLTTTGLIEQGRVTASGEPLLVSLSLPDGTYTEAQMARELTLQANSTPPFQLISYEDFRDVFMVTRDVSVLFNEPSDCYYSRIQGRRFGTHTKADIMGAYYTQAHLDSFPVVTERIAFNAYWYPVLKEMVATGRAEPFLQTDGMPYTAVAGRVMTFEGLDSEFYELLAQRNRGSLEVYRRHFTFEYRNVNRYVCTYDEAARRSVITHGELHLSLQRDLQLRQAHLMDQALTLAGVDTFGFTTLKHEMGQAGLVVRHMLGNLSTVLAGYHLWEGLAYEGGSVYRGRIEGVASTLSVEELDRDPEFTTMFQYTSSFGGAYGGFVGVRSHVSSFLGYHSTLSSHWAVYQSTQVAVSSLHGGVYQRFHEYVASKYRGVLPAEMIERRTYHVPQGLPVSFVPGRSVYIPGEGVGAGAATANAVGYLDVDCKAICCSTLRGMIASWYSCLPTNFVLQTLSYRLGLINTTPAQFNLLSTVMDITSTGNLNLYMNINDEQGFNNIDIVMPENYGVTNETTGQVKLMCAKILMGQLGDTGISQTVIQNPSLFENGLGKLDKLDIKIYYDDQNISPAWVYQPYNLDILEWNATFQIDEEVGFANRATGWGTKPTVPVPKNPDHTPYLFFTHRDNPNNS